MLGLGLLAGGLVLYQSLSLLVHEDYDSDVPGRFEGVEAHAGVFERTIFRILHKQFGD